jgi:hypothetical protein
LEFTENILRYHGIDLSIQAFDTSIELDNIKAKRYSDRENYFKRGESHTMVLDVLRKAKEPLTTSQITKELMKKKKLNPEDQNKVDSIQKSLLHTLKKHEKAKRIQIVNKDNINGFTWELV